MCSLRTSIRTAASCRSSPTRRKNARALLASSAMKLSRPRIVLITGSGSTSPGSPSPSVDGTRNKAPPAVIGCPAAASAATARVRSTLRRSAGKPGRSVAIRSARWGRRPGSARAERCPAPRILRCPRNRTAALGPDRPRSAMTSDVGIGLGSVPPAAARGRFALATRRPPYGTRPRGRWPALSCSCARSRLPGLSKRKPSSSATWSDPMITAVGKKAAAERAFAAARRSAVSSGRSSGNGVSSTRGAKVSNSRCSRASSSRRYTDVEARTSIVSRVPRPRGSCVA